MAVPFNPETHVIVNLQNRPTTVFDEKKHPVTVQPYRDMGPQGHRRNGTGIYVLVNAHYAQFVGGQGPLYLKPKAEVEAHLGGNFQDVVDVIPTAASQTGTPMGKSAAGMEAEAVARNVGRRNHAGAAVATAPVAAPVTAPVVEEDPEADDPDTAPEGDGPEIELHTLSELEAKSINDLREYAGHWSITGRSKRALLDKLIEQECVASADA